MNRTVRVPLWTIFVCALLVPRPATADVIYTNIGVGADPYSLFGVAFGGMTEQAHADWFIASSSGTVGRLEVPIALFQGDASTAVRFTLLTDANTFPGTPIATFTFTNVPAYPPNPQLTGLSIANASVGAMLTAGRKYWLLGEAALSSTFIGWMQNTTGDDPGPNHFVRERNAQGQVGSRFENLGPKGAFTLSTERFDPSAPVPEPATILLLGSGAALIGARRPRSRRGR